MLLDITSETPILTVQFETPDSFLWGEGEVIKVYKLFSVPSVGDSVYREDTGVPNHLDRMTVSSVVWDIHERSSIDYIIVHVVCRYDSPVFKFFKYKYYYPLRRVVVKKYASKNFKTGVLLRMFSALCRAFSVVVEVF